MGGIIRSFSTESDRFSNRIANLKGQKKKRPKRSQRTVKSENLREQRKMRSALPKRNIVSREDLLFK